MARIAVGSWMVRYPLGGNLSWTLQWLVGLQRLGHDVYLVEKSGYSNSCFDPSLNIMSDDCSFGSRAVDGLLRRFDLHHRWCYVDAAGTYHGLTRTKAEEICRTTNVFLDIGSHGTWLDEMVRVPVRVLIDGEPGTTQMKMELQRRAGLTLHEYNYYYTNGANVGTPHSTAPTAGRTWRSVFNPVVVDLFRPSNPSARRAAFTTVMNWQAHEPLHFDGRVFGQKDVEFAKFLDLPQRTSCPLEVAASGRVPTQQLTQAGWHLRNGQEVSATYDGYLAYISESAGEFSVCKHVYVATRTGWFSDRSAAYLASGRPVVLQDTGFSAHLPCGKGLFAVNTVDEAAAAIDDVKSDYRRHCNWAREIAREHLDAGVVLAKLLEDVGV
jgi:hypothetical protein